MDEGRGWMVYLGHGSGYDFSSLSPPYSVTHVAQQNNEGMWPYITDCSCLNGGFQVPGDDSLDEALMKAGTPEAPMGALGVFGSSTSTSWDPAGEIAEGTSYGVMQHDHAIWGATALYGREHVYEIYGGSMDTEWLFEQWVLFGDASEMIRTRSPSAPEIDYPAGFPMAQSDFVVAVAVDGHPIRGATVALHKDDEWDLVASTDAAGEALFSLTPTQKGPMDVVITGRDLVTHIGTSEAGAAAGGFGSGCAAAASPFNYNPVGVGFTAAITPGSPLTGAAGLALLSLLAAARLRRRHQPR
jgi:MYXO-CTERM domain-containing protein